MATAEHKMQRVELTKDPLNTIAAARRDSWSHFTVADENRFY
jgi:hypothetical protein